MLESSEFMAPDDEILFEKVDQLQSSGQTSLSYLVSRNGEQIFMKRLRPEYANDAHYRLIFKKEFITGHKISHPNIVGYKEIGENVNGPYILMEYITGETLEEKLNNNPCYFCNDNNLKKFITQLLDALECLHSSNILYCDLSPSNIMLTRINNDVKIIDLGFCDTDGYVFTAGMTKGFNAPETLHQKRSELDASTDIYSVGKLMEYIEKKRGKQLSHSFHQIMKRCLEEDKAMRFGSAAEMATTLNQMGKRKNILWKLVGLTAIIAILLGWSQFDNQTAAMDKDRIVTIGGVHYAITSEDSATCMVVGRDSLIKNVPEEGLTIYIKDNIKIDGKTYTTTEIGDSAFYEYQDIVTVHLPATLRKIGNEAFYKNSSLISLNIPEGVTEIGDKCFYACNIKDLKLPKSLRTINWLTFAENHHLESVFIPEGLETLELDAFGVCYNMTSVKLPSTLKTIARGVFWKCESLEEITIPAGVTTIGDYAFYYCKKLKHIYNLSPEPQRVSIIFNHKLNVHVPAASVEKYRKAHQWKDMNIVGDIE